MSDYVSKAKVVSIRATSRASVKFRDSYYTMEYTEERVIPEVPEVDIEQERALLWDLVNAEVDNQVESTLMMLKKNS